MPQRGVPTPDRIRATIALANGKVIGLDSSGTGVQGYRRQGGYPVPVETIPATRLSVAVQSERYSCGKFDTSKLAYIGINIAPTQNDYVLPFLKSSGHTFTPLEESSGRDKGNLENHNSAPTNFLIDQEGRIVFRDFLIDDTNEETLEGIISGLILHNEPGDNFSG